LIKLCSINLVATAIANPPELNIGRGVLHGALQTLHYDLIDMHKLNPNIQEVIAFTKWLLVTNVYPAPNFMQICTLVEHVVRNNFYFKSGD
jgi:hypothetical protein